MKMLKKLAKMHGKARLALFAAMLSVLAIAFFYLAGSISPSPDNSLKTGNYVGAGNIQVYDDRIVISIEHAMLGAYADTGSMIPVLDDKTIGIKVIPASDDEIRIGDIITFQRDGILVIHRVVEKGTDKNGTYFITKGDSNLFNDGKIRFEDIEYKTIMLIY
ncbi:MAG TPA: hypothetical protein VJA86_03960 [Candidatus Nanoarchaeia archaeon]|nr:hypothetical protein [Candidatus Nanoarchaeia archaeon]